MAKKLSEYDDEMVDKDAAEDAEEGEEEAEDGGEDFEEEDGEENEEDEPEEEEHDEGEDEADEEEGEGGEESLPAGTRVPRDGSFIPRTRLNKYIAKAAAREQELQDRITQLLVAQLSEKKRQEKEEPTVEYDFDEAEEKYLVFVQEGDLDQASKLRKEINKAHKQYLENVLKASRKDTVAETLAQLEEQNYQTSLAEFTLIPIFNERSKEYNPKAVELANSLAVANYHKGKPKAQALKEAVEDVLNIYAKPTKQGTREAAMAKSKSEEKRRLVQLAKRQPADNVNKRREASRDLSTLKIRRLSDKEFSKLTPKERAALRGDFL